MRALSITEQDRLIRKQWPEMRTMFLADGFGRWRGFVQTFSKTYEIIITYVTSLRQKNYIWNYAWHPVVEVVRPKVQRREEEPDKPVPHVYDELRRRVLCLFDPKLNGWSVERPIADTILPWAADWLRQYEIWQATGDWKGGGRDHVIRDWAPAKADVSPCLNAKVFCALGMFASQATIAQGMLDHDLPPGPEELSNLVVGSANGVVDVLRRVA